MMLPPPPPGSAKPREVWGKGPLGLSKGSDGPFRCDHCARLSRPGGCGWPEVIANDNFGLNPDGTAHVDADYCCGAWWKKGTFDPEGWRVLKVQ